MNANDVIESRYRLERQLGEGGMGAVWLAHDLTLGKKVALKTLLPKMIADERAVAQLKKEVRLSQELRHPNICATYDFHDRGDCPFLVMEFVDGETLSNHVFRQPNHRITEREFQRLAAEVLNAVGHAHSVGIIHRDLKSGNIMVTREGSVRVMDFGIAASLKETQSRTTGAPVSLSIHFASPEQINGEAPSASMDIYSLGCVFYEMLTGDPPFRQGDILHQQLTRQPESMPGVSAELNRVVLACLTKDPKQRLRSCGEVAAALNGDRTVKLGKPATEELRPTASHIGQRQDRQERDPRVAPRVTFTTTHARWMWAAAAFLATVGICLVIWNSRPRETDSSPAVSETRSPAGPAVSTPQEQGSGIVQPAGVRERLSDKTSVSAQPEVAPRLARGKQMLHEGDYAGAVSEFNAVLKIDSGNKSARAGVHDAQSAWEAEGSIQGFDSAAISRQAIENCPGKLSEDQLSKLVAGRVPEPRLLRYVNQCGVGFRWNEELRAGLERAGATQIVLTAAKLKADEYDAGLRADDGALFVSAEGQNTIAAYEDYLRRFPDGAYVAAARRQIDALKAALQQIADEAAERERQQRAAEEARKAAEAAQTHGQVTAEKTSKKKKAAKTKRPTVQSEGQEAAEQERARQAAEDARQAAEAVAARQVEGSAIKKKPKNAKTAKTQTSEN